MTAGHTARKSPWPGKAGSFTIDQVSLNVRFGSIAALQTNTSPMSGSGVKRPVRSLEIG
jgi:hypothetical protein